jgi:hypothetical protein
MGCTMFGHKAPPHQSDTTRPELKAALRLPLLRESMALNRTKCSSQQRCGRPLSGRDRARAVPRGFADMSWSPWAKFGTGYSLPLSFACRPSIQQPMLLTRGRFMVSLAIVSLLAGAVLGWWFKIPVLVLAIFLALVVVAGVGAAVASLWWIALDVFVVTICLQLGYVAGSALETYTAFRGQRRALRESRRAADASPRPQQP